jgi:hypothetical protein
MRASDARIMDRTWYGFTVRIAAGRTQLRAVRW